MSSTNQRVLTDAPLVDEIVYECKQILKGIVVKDEKSANEAESKQSIRNADIYHDIQMGTDRFEFYEYTYDVFMKIPHMNPKLAMQYATGQVAIPDALKSELMKIAREKWLSNYVETNEYYRKLAGLPPIGEEPIYLTEDDYLKIPIESYDISKPIHECTVSEAALLESAGIIDDLKERYPEAKYLNYIGEKSIDPYLARRALPFSMLYMPPVDSPEVANKWRERFDINRVYILQTVYSEAYKFHSEYYDRFIMIMIVLQTFEDMIVFSPEYIIERNLFDLRTIQFIFEACGVTFYPEIPLKYQKRLVKNLNRLIKYKSSAKCMVDIVSLFGYENMELFKYYLLKTPNVNEDGSYRKDTYTDPETGEEIEDLEANYKLQFLKVPLDDIADDYISDPSAYVDYDETVGEDIWWNGIYTKEYVKHKILEHEFNIHKSKYISIDTVYSLTEMQFQMVYFINMLLYSKVNTDKLLVDVPELSANTQFKLTDLLLTLFSLSYLYNGTRDNIIYDPVRSLDVKGFNFTTDMNKLEEYLKEEGYTLEDLGLNEFKNPTPQGLQSWENMHDVYTSNKKTYEKLIHLMNNANNYDEYKVYRTVYQALYVTKLNFDMFDVDELDRKPKTYMEYLLYKSIPLYDVIQSCEAIQKDTERQLEISRVINYIVEDIYCYLDKDEFKYVFNGIPTVSLDYVRQYIFDIINFFKSYKVDVIHTSIIYKFDDRLENRIYVIDKILFKYLFTKTDRITINDCMKLLNTVNWREDIPIIEQIFMDITYWKSKRFGSKCIVDDKDHWRELLVHITYHSNMDIRDCIPFYSHTYYWNLHLPYRDESKLLNNLYKLDSTDIADSIIIESKIPKRVLQIVESVTLKDNILTIIADPNYRAIFNTYRQNGADQKVPKYLDMTYVTVPDRNYGMCIMDFIGEFCTKDPNMVDMFRYAIHGIPEGKGTLHLTVAYDSGDEFDPQEFDIPYGYSS